MRSVVLALLTAAVAACSFVTIADRYGNQYGDWYNPGSNFTWQLGVCEQQMETGRIPPMSRKAAMRCCMRDHGVPVDDARGCGT